MYDAVNVFLIVDHSFWLSFISFRARGIAHMQGMGMISGSRSGSLAQAAKSLA